MTANGSDKALPKTPSPQTLANTWEKTLAEAAKGTLTGIAAKTLIMPPPNVTGSLHIGHALTFTLQDVWIKFWRMQKTEVLAQPGLDHAGIATQMMVEKALATEGLSRQDVGRQAFVERAYAYKNDSGDTIVHQLKKLGISAQWDRLKFTLDDDIQQTVKDVFVQLYREDLIYRSKRLVYWDPVLKTALSSLEVQSKEVSGSLWTLRYHGVDDPATYLDIATTRPETLFGDTAVAVHPEDDRYKHWIGKQVRVPLTDRCVTVVADDHVERDKGTGVLKITPAHDFVDAAVGKAHNLEVLTILDEEARLTDCVPEVFRGLGIKEARKKVLEMLEEQGLLIDTKAIRHVVPVGDRSGCVLEPRLTHQWFLNAKPLAEKALKALDDGEFAFVPEHYGNTYRRWLENIEPWCLSRQLWWGHAIPAWYGPDETAFVASSDKEAHEQARAHYGKDVTLTADPDVLDTWFSSGLWPLVTLGWPDDPATFKNFYPTDTLVTGFDIIFFWVARMVMLGKHLTGEVPFRTVYIHGLVRDAQRQKMSKTKGNVVNPLDVLDDYGPDALRLALTLRASPGRDVAFSEKHVEGARNFLTKLWNAARFTLSKGAVYPDATPQPDHPFNQWLMAKTHAMQQTYTDAMKAYRFDEAAQKLYHFVWGTYCDLYIEMSKKLLASTADEALISETQQVSGWAMGACLKMLFPLVPFITSELWTYVAPGQPPLHTVTDQPIDTQPIDTTDVDTLIAWIGEVRRLRASLSIPFGTALQLYVQDDVPALSAHQAFVTAFLNVTLKNDDFPKEPGFYGAVQGASFFIPLQGVIDLVGEKEKLNKKHAKVQQQATTLQERLNNPDFKAKAPAERVEEMQTMLTQVEQEERALTQMLRSLSA